MSSVSKRNGKGFFSGAVIGALGGLIGLGGAEFRLPVLIGSFKIPTLEAVIFNKAMSLAVVAVALIFRTKSISPDQLMDHLDIVINLLAGSLIGAWWAADRAIRMSRVWLDRIIYVLLVLLSFVLLSEAWMPLHSISGGLFQPGIATIIAGVISGFFIGIFAALLGVAGGELLIPTIVILFGADIKLAGSLSLMISLPTMIVGFSRYMNADAFQILRKEKSLFMWMVTGSVIGAAIGGLLTGLFPVKVLMTLLGIILLISAIKTFNHIRNNDFSREGSV
ncbi:sulfite exporter TauE/SafE family protein [Salmonella enterica subsp. enterica serovar Oranienburg]|nr:sulfite exporter TauE/SafE family protein [Salmonella enterica subsp. enterica serovar Oranienburg]ECA1475521.1 sulfite exporter TauE/SafE family protein [Salmonella enterica subsp. enterica serovar Oranienburg]ECA9001432.1 sulfite exporter TauE/SafE family protein [Salmonella enterica subsp. enterica serovar Oranienburg]ECA9348316.1 sulfite exporter TauE/SafE family protein [Salmonella enterica subsp. enterica serovar Oranienburg]ECD3081651.1 sulfite exporter TauE/SafE family protein [Salmo